MLAKENSARLQSWLGTFAFFTTHINALFVLSLPAKKRILHLTCRSATPPLNHRRCHRFSIQGQSPQPLILPHPHQPIPRPQQHRSQHQWRRLPHCQHSDAIPVDSGLPSPGSSRDICENTRTPWTINVRFVGVGSKSPGSSKTT